MLIRSWGGCVPTTLLSLGIRLVAADAIFFRAGMSGVVYAVNAILFAFVLSLAYRRLTLSDGTADRVSVRES